ncbi:hypothetical protein F3Y22_tig00110429pilonHSYRG00580 [Hibiscus syriacus]|uniref:Reverse transcriptase zinc-binding domain-containing protein n=1 Tax=Hibiscus syriacus TaxID=106335 RepID=A0A6A3AL14_HIBSY|nr:hypothetical protein F3Y22_tig00110429pilonHSYRG00580 [Hibiscus syriacus]
MLLRQIEAKMDPSSGSLALVFRNVFKTIPEIILNIQANVRDFVTNEGNWNTNLMHKVLEEETVQRILRVSIPSDKMGQDQPTWRWEQSGICTVKLAFVHLQHDNWDAEDNIWRLVWDYDGPKRIRQFIWLIPHKKLMTNVERMKRNLSSENHCPVCGTREENIGRCSVLQVEIGLCAMTWKHGVWNLAVEVDNTETVRIPNSQAMGHEAAIIRRVGSYFNLQ